MDEVTFRVEAAPFPEPLSRALVELVGEIFGPFDDTDFRWRLDKLPDATLSLAEADSQLLGFKFGHALSSKRYQSWLGGVHPRARRRGIARRLMEIQHEWVASQGFESIETSAIHDNEPMLALNRAFGFEIIGQYERDGAPRLIHYKRLRTGA